MPSGMSAQQQQLTREEIQQIIAAKEQKKRVTGLTNQDLQEMRQLRGMLSSAPSARDMEVQQAQQQMDTTLAVESAVPQPDARAEQVAANEEAAANDKLLRRNGVNPADLSDDEETAAAEKIRENELKANNQENDLVSKFNTGSASTQAMLGSNPILLQAAADRMFGELPEPPRTIYNDTIDGEKYNPLTDIMIDNADGKGGKAISRPMENPKHNEWKAANIARAQAVQALIASNPMALAKGSAPQKPAPIGAIESYHEAQNEALKSKNAPVDTTLSKDEQEVAIARNNSAAADNQRLASSVAQNYPGVLPQTGLVGQPGQSGAAFSDTDLAKKLRAATGWSEEQTSAVLGNFASGGIPLSFQAPAFSDPSFSQ